MGFTKIFRLKAGKAFVNLLTALMFIAADRRYTNVLPMLRWLSLRLCKNEAVGEDLLLPFLREWACLAAQAARRDWLDVTAQLLNGLFYLLLKQNSFALTRSMLLYVMMHMQMYAAWDGAEKAFTVYAPVQKFSLLLFDRFVKSKDENQRVEAVRLLLRLPNLRRNQSWFAFGEAAESEKYKKRCRLFIQLTLGYWSAQQPRTSKKQLKYLKNIFEPDLVKDKYLRLLEAVR